MRGTESARRRLKDSRGPDETHPRLVDCSMTTVGDRLYELVVDRFA
jgi:hypothetical protein